MYQRILTAFYSSPWAILPAKLEEMRAFLAQKAAGHDIDPAQIKAAMGSRRPLDVTMVGRVALVPVFGVISQRTSMLDEASGGISTEAIGATLDSLVNDRGCKSIVMVFDSPGGSVFGVQELGDRIKSYQGQKKIVGIADSMAASAAFWLATQCQELYCTPGGQVGSVGVLAAHVDVSKAEEEAGVKTTVVTAGKYKAEFSSSSPLSDEARAELQSKVDGYYEMFLASVAGGRGTTPTKVKANYGQGRMMTAEQAKQAGAIDGIRTLAQLLEKVGAYDVQGAKAEDSQPPVTAQVAAVRARALEISP